MTAILAMVPSWAWRWLAWGIAAAAIAGAIFVKGLLVGERKFDAYQAQVEAQGQAQAKAAAGENKRQAAIKKENDDAYQKAKADRARAVTALNEWMRTHPGSGVVPGADAAPGSPEATQACYDPAILDQRIGASIDRLQGRLAGIVSRGKQAEDDLKLALDWALKIPPPK